MAFTVPESPLPDDPMIRRVSDKSEFSTCSFGDFIKPSTFKIDQRKIL